MLTNGIQQWLELWSEDEDALLQGQFKEYRSEFPKSAFAPVLEAMQIHAAAWRARGRGFASTVTREGWALFRQRNQAAWKAIQAAKPGSSRLPVMFACRAEDAGTYALWRRSVDPEQFQAAAPQGVTLEICDARFKSLGEKQKRPPI